MRSAGCIVNDIVDEKIDKKVERTKNRPIASGKLNKFISDNTLLNQEWIIDPKKKVKNVIKEVAGSDKIIIKKFIRFKVGEGV